MTHTKTDNPFVTLAAINVNEHVEKKGSLSYLSWPWAVDQLMRLDPDASWEYLEPIRYGDTMQVVCAVTAFGRTKTERLPVMDHRNKPIANPDAFQVNTAEKRCLVKAIALHGLGLYIYAGEDLPGGEEAKQEPRPNTAKQVAVDAFDQLDPDEQAFLRERAIEIIAFCEDGQTQRAISYIEEQRFDTEEKLAIWSLLPANVRGAIKKQQREVTTQ